MKEFDPDQFLFMGGIHTARKMAIDDSRLLSQQDKEDCLHDAECSETLCNTLGLSISKMGINRIKDLLSQDKVSLKQFVQLLNELDNRIIDEMKDRKFLCIESDKVKLLEGKNLFGMEVTNAFPSATVDIEEAGKCFAVERWTASVFHLMRVVEIGLQVLGDTLKLPLTTNRNWESILKKCDSELAKPLAQRSPEWAADDTFFSSTTAMLRSVKDAWRNPTMHVGKVYTEEQVEGIWNAVKAFMRLLATKLKEDTDA